MAQTTAQRQAAYRARRATAGKEGNGERRLDMWVSTEADLALARLARRFALTKRQIAGAAGRAGGRRHRAPARSGFEAMGSLL